MKKFLISCLVILCSCNSTQVEEEPTLSAFELSLSGLLITNVDILSSQEFGEFIIECEKYHLFTATKREGVQNGLSIVRSTNGVICENTDVEKFKGSLEWKKYFFPTNVTQAQYPFRVIRNNDILFTPNDDIGVELSKSF